MAPAKKGKRSAREAAIAAVAARNKASIDEKAQATEQAEEPAKDELVYEDPYEDEFESESDNEEADHGRPVEEGEPGSDGLRVFRPGMDSLRPGEQMVHDVTAYEMMHKLNVEWPALSFDILQNDQVQVAGKAAYPMKVYVVSGTQADKASKNKIVVMKMSNLYRTRAKTKKNPAEDDDDDDESDDDDDEIDADADERGCVLEHQEIKHDGVVNRIRSMPQKEQIVATWSENSRVYLTDIDSCLQGLDRGNRMPTPGAPLPSAVRPFYSFGGHSTEGYAMDWSRIEAGRLVTGDCRHDVYLWQMRESTFQVDPTSFRGHRESVEDIQWSPTEGSVFASCSVDKSIKFWDIRQSKKSPALSVDEAHDTDINVISWNRIDPHLLLSGCDNGALKVWDLRSVKSAGSGAEPAADFRYHRKPITSVEWHPQESSMLAASSEDNSCSIWDLGVERDPEEEARMGTILPGAEDIPAQLLFVHLGQADIKEVHWHPTLSSVLVTTAADGFNVIRPVDMF